MVFDQMGDPKIPIILCPHIPYKYILFNTGLGNSCEIVLYYRSNLFNMAKRIDASIQLVAIRNKRYSIALAGLRCQDILLNGQALWFRNCGNDGVLVVREFLQGNKTVPYAERF